MATPLQDIGCKAMRLRQRCALVGLLVVCSLLAACDDRPSAGRSGGETVISIWAHRGQEKEYAALKAIIAAFNAKHAAEGLRADATFFPDRQYADKVSIASASGNLPDVVEVDGPFVGPWAAEGLLQPIDDLVDQALRDDLLPSIIEQGTYNDRLYALGAFESALVVYYNREIIEKAGLNPPRLAVNAWSWEAFIDALERVRPHASIPLSLHMDEQSDEWFTYAFSPLVWSAGGSLIDTQRRRASGVLDGPRTVGAIRRWQALFERGLAERTSPNPNPFGAGLAAFDWTGHWMLPSFEQTDGLRLGAMPLPRMGEQSAFASGSWCWALTSGGRNRGGAWKLIEWLIDAEQGVRPIGAADGAVPARRSAFDFFPAFEHMPRRLFRDQLETAAHPRPRTPVYLTLRSEFARALRDIALGADVQPRLTDAAEAVQRALDRHPATTVE